MGKNLNPCAVREPALIFVMGVGGSGKTTAARSLAGELGAGWAFLDADDFHPPANKAKMAAGTPLTERDREPWLAALRARLDEAGRTGGNIVLACSALRRAHRDALIGRRESSRMRVTLVYLKASRELLRERLAARRGHFLNPSLLDNQLAIFDEPSAEEAARMIVVEAALSEREIVSAIRRAL